MTLTDTSRVDSGVFTQVANTICATTNNGKNRAGTILIGVADKGADAERIEKIHGTEYRTAGRRHVVGVRREAKWLKVSADRYPSCWRDAIRNSDLSMRLRDSALGSTDYDEYFSLGVIVTPIPVQKALSPGERLYIRNADETIEVTSPVRSAQVAGRFT